MEWIQANDKGSFFAPNGAQEKFLNIIAGGENLVSILSTANGVGKTALLVNIARNLIFGPCNSWFQKDVFKNWPYPKRIRYITDPKLVEDIGPFHSEIEKWWPKGRYEALKAGHTYYSQYKANGWIVDVMTYDQEISQFEGGNIGLIMTDEPPPKSIWHACITRLRLGGFMLVSMTPLTQAAWFFDDVVPRHPQSIVYASMEDNCKEHGVRGQLEHNRIQEMIAEMDPDEVEARAYGRAMYLKGLIYKNFDFNVHVAKAPIAVPETAELWHIVDPAIDKPFAMIWGFPDKDGTFYQVAEWPTEDFYRMHQCDFGLEDYKKIILAAEQGWNVRRRIIDRHFADVRSLNTKRTLREDLGNVGLSFEGSYAAQEEIETGILKVRSYLRYDSRKPLDSVNRPHYVVSPTCKNTIKGFQRWSFDTKTGKPRDDYKDFMDCVRYALMVNPKVTELPPPNEPRRLYG